LRKLSESLDGGAEKGHSQTPDVEALFTYVWRQARTAGEVSLGGESYEGSVILVELLHHLGSLAEGVRLRMYSRLAKLYKSYLESWVEKAGSLTLITFNYDMLVEHLLDSTGISFDAGGNRDFAFVDSGRSRDIDKHGSDVTLLKLHGSVSWGLCHGCRRAEDGDDVVAIWETSYVPGRRRSCPFCQDRYLEPGIIPPIVGKAGELRYMEPLWRDARAVLRSADRLEMVGYSLPPADAEAASLLREASHLRTGGAITAICGDQGVSPQLRDLFPGLVDTRTRFEEYLEVNHTP
jgi:hypothetical protein